MNVLVVAAHPDDEVLGCGGTIAKLAASGNEVFIAIMGEGVTSRYDCRDQADQDLLASLQQDSRRVADLLGASDLFTFQLADNRFDSVDLLDVIKMVEGLVDRIEPEVVYTHHGGDLNIDHQVVNRAVLTATRPVPGSAVKQVYTYEVASSTEWAFGAIQPVFVPNTFVDISGQLGTKLEAMRLYEGESRAFPHPRSSEALEAIARRWGSAAGLDAAEAFMLVRAVQR